MIELQWGAGKTFQFFSGASDKLTRSLSWLQFAAVGYWAVMGKQFPSPGSLMN